jgi:predicted Zn-dependent protease
MQIGAIAASIALGGWTGYAIRQGMGLAIPLGYLQFSQEFEKQADYYGLQYMYKSGYDPTAFVDFFEKVQTLEKKKPGSLSKVFSTHPMTDARIKHAQEEIQSILKPKPEYIVTTSEFNDVRSRLAMMHNHRMVDKNADPSRPTLRRNTGTGNGPVDSTTPASNDDDRPTLKRRDSGSSSGNGGNGNGNNQ